MGNPNSEAMTTPSVTYPFEASRGERSFRDCDKRFLLVSPVSTYRRQEWVAEDTMRNRAPLAKSRSRSDE